MRVNSLCSNLLGVVLTNILGRQHNVIWLDQCSDLPLKCSIYWTANYSVKMYNGIGFLLPLQWRGQGYRSAAQHYVLLLCCLRVNLLRARVNSSLQDSMMVCTAFYLPRDVFFIIVYIGLLSFFQPLYKQCVKLLLVCLLLLDKRRVTKPASGQMLRHNKLKRILPIK